MGRRTQKIVSVWNVATNNFVPAATSRFVYDGWNLMGELGSNNSPLRSYTWGNDLSGSSAGVGGVGGVGGLLAMQVYTNSAAATYGIFAYDGNGNVTAIICAADESLEARYDYSPYGQLIRKTGPLATQNPFRYSTKFWDEESGLVYYGYRYYSPVLGRWFGRDLSQEVSGLNLYSFNFNDGIDSLDTLGDTSAKDVNLGQGYTGNLQTFDTGGNASFELHVYDTGGNEVGVVGPDGWIMKHGFKGPPQLSDDVMRVVKGVAVDAARGAGMIPKGASIRNWLWNGTMGALNRSGRIGGAIVGVLAIQAAVEGGLQAADDAKDYARDMKNGDSAWADLDAACVAGDVVNATGNYYMGYEALDILLSN
jgi:RHS repeat-associated protein